MAALVHFEAGFSHLGEQYLLQYPLQVKLRFLRNALNSSTKLQERLWNLYKPKNNERDLLCLKMT